MLEIAESVRLAETAPSPFSDFDIVDGLLYHAQEGLLAQYET
jgi:hypothetical protein